MSWAGGAGRDPFCRSRRGVVAKSSTRSERKSGSSPATGPAARLVLCSALIGFLALPLSASELARTFRVPVGGASLRVSVPKTFEPLLPGSVYPNRRKPVAARSLPVAILDPDAKPALEFLLERGFLVVQRHSEPVAGVLAALSTHPEADPTRAVVIAARSLPTLSPNVRAAAVLDPELDSKRSGQEVPGRIAVFLRTPERAPSEELTRRLRERFGRDAIEKWYRSEEKFPEQAYRDAAEIAAAAAR